MTTPVAVSEGLIELKSETKFNRTGIPGKRGNAKEKLQRNGTPAREIPQIELGQGYLLHEAAMAFDDNGKMARAIRKLLAKQWGSKPSTVYNWVYAMGNYAEFGKVNGKAPKCLIPATDLAAKLMIEKFSNISIKI